MFRKKGILISSILLAMVFVLLTGTYGVQKLQVNAYAEDHVYFSFGTSNTTAIFRGEDAADYISMELENEQADHAVKSESQEGMTNYAYFTFGPANATYGLNSRDAENIELGNNISMGRTDVQGIDNSVKEEGQAGNSGAIQENIKAFQRTDVNDNETIVLIFVGLLLILLPFIGWIHDKRKGIRYNRVRGGRQLYLEMRKAR